MNRLTYTISFILIYILLGSLDANSQSDTTEPEILQRESVIKIIKLQKEINKLEQEIIDLKCNNEALTLWYRRITPIAGGILGAAVAIFLAFLNRTFSVIQKEKLKQEKSNEQEKHNITLFNSLGDKNERIRLGAAAVLLQKLQTLNKESKKVNSENDKETIMKVLSAVLKEGTSTTDSKTHDVLQKFIADNLILSVHAKKDVPLRIDSPLKICDFQGANLKNVWWKNVNAQGVDFFGADFTDASLTDSQLNDAVFSRACLNNTKFRFADLSGAILTNADLTKADFTEANLKNANLSDVKIENTIFTNAILDGAYPKETVSLIKKNSITNASSRRNDSTQI